MTNTQANTAPAPIIMSTGHALQLIASSSDGGGVYTQGLEYSAHDTARVALHAWIGDGNLTTDEHLIYALSNPRTVDLPTGGAADEGLLYTHDRLPRTWWIEDGDLLIVAATADQGFAYDVATMPNEATPVPANPWCLCGMVKVGTPGHEMHDITAPDEQATPASEGYTLHSYVPEAGIVLGASEWETEAEALEAMSALEFTSTPGTVLAITHTGQDLHIYETSV